MAQEPAAGSLPEGSEMLQSPVPVFALFSLRQSCFQNSCRRFQEPFRSEPTVLPEAAVWIGLLFVGGVLASAFAQLPVLGVVSVQSHWPSEQPVAKQAQPCWEYFQCYGAVLGLVSQ